MQVGSGADAGFQHAAAVAGHAGSLGNGRGLQGGQRTARLGQLQREDVGRTLLHQVQRSGRRGQRFATRRPLDEHFRQAGVRPVVVVEIDSVDALERLVAHGTAAAFLPARSTQATAQIHLPQVTDPRPVRPAGLVRRRSGYRSTAAKAFVSVLQRTV